MSSRKLGVKSFGMGQDEGHYTVRIDEFTTDMSWRELPEDFRLPPRTDAMILMPEVLLETERTVTSSGASAFDGDLGGSGEAAEMQAVQLARPPDQGVPPAGGGVRGRVRYGDRPGGGAAPEAQEEQSSRAAAERGWETAECAGCTSGGQPGFGCGDLGFDGRGDGDGDQTASQGGSSKEQGGPAPSLDRGEGGLPEPVAGVELGCGAEHCRVDEKSFGDVRLEADALAAEGEGGSGGGRRPAVEEESALAGALALPGSSCAVGAHGGDEAEAEQPGRVAHDVTGPRRPNRGTTQRLKAGVTAGKAIMAALIATTLDPGNYKVVEVVDGAGSLASCLRGREGWEVAEVIDVAGGWTPDLAKRLKEAYKQIELQQPDLVVLSPRPWMAEPTEDPSLWEARRAQLPLWKWVAEVWKLQQGHGRLVVVVQPAQSQALHLSFMKERDGVIKVPVAMCAFVPAGEQRALRNFREVMVEVNHSVLGRRLQDRGWCPCGPRAHLVPGEAKASAGITRLRWPSSFCERLVSGAEEAFKQLPGGSLLGLGDSVPQDEDWAWETAPVSNAAVPEEGLRQALQEQGSTGERYDYITYDGPAIQQPRRLRQTVAHLHVTLGHLSNERLARMLSLSGGQASVVDLAKKLRCQVCAMVRPPQATPQVAYRKPKQFNERVMGDSFYIWDKAGQKFVVTHYIDGLTDYHIGDLTDRPDSGFAREILQDLWIASFGAPDLLVTDGGPEFCGEIETVASLFGMVHEVVPEGAKWRMGLAERHGAIIKLMMMRMVTAMGLTGMVPMRQACLAAFAAKNRTVNKGGVSPMQAVTGRSTCLPGSLMQQICTGEMRYQYNQAMETNEALQRADRIRQGAVEAFFWLDAHSALRKALTSRSRPPTLEGIREGATVYVYDPPVSRRGQARRLQDHSSWSGPGVIVCVERDTPVPQRVWVRLRGRVKAFPLEKIRLATLDEMVSAQFVTDALKEVEAELQGGQIKVDDEAKEADKPAASENPPAARRSARRPASSSSSSSETSDTDGGDKARPAVDPQSEEQERRAKLLDDVPMAMKTFADRRKSEEAALADPHALDFAKKRKLFEKLSKALEPPSVLEEGMIREQLTDIYGKFKEVKKALNKQKGPRRARGGGKASARTEAGRHASGVMVVEEEVDASSWFAPGEYEAMLQDTLGHWVLWSSPSVSAGVPELREVSLRLQREEAEAMAEGVTEVKTGKARIEYRWKELDGDWQTAFVPALKKAIGVYLEHHGIRGVAADKVLDPKRILSSRFVLTNKGGEDLASAEPKARWIFGGHRDPDAGLYATSAPTASTLAHNLLNFVAVQLGWTVHYEDVASAFLQGKDLPRTEKVFVRVPQGYPQEVLDYLVEELGGGVRGDVVELTKAGFGLPESPRLWYLEYKDTIEEIGLKELTLVPGMFRAFHPNGKLRALASIHVDDTRYAGDETSGELWDLLHQRLKFGKMRKATDGWQKFCGRWELQAEDGREMRISMQEYIKTIPLVKARPSAIEAASAEGSSMSRPESTTTSTSGGPNRSSPESATTSTSGGPSRSSPESATTSTSGGPSMSSRQHEPDETSEGVVEYIHDVITGVGAESELTPEEKRLIGSVVGQLNWAARQGRYDLGFVASLIQQLAGQGKAEALRWVNAAVRRAREPMEVLVRKFDCDLSELLVVSVSDAAYGAMPNGSSQGGTMVLFADPAVLHGQGAVCIMEAASVKIQRVVRCSMSAEVSSLATAFEHGDFVRAVLAELLDPTFRMDRWKLSASRWRHLLVTDAKTGYDAISSEVLPSDRKIAIDVGVLRQGLLEPETANFIRWVPGSEMPGDGLTKWGHNNMLTKVMTEGQWSLVDTPEAQALRKAAATKRAVWRSQAKSRLRATEAPSVARACSSPEGVRVKVHE